MQKISENIVLKSIDTELICCLQSKGDFDYREVLQVKNDGKVWCCINTDKFIAIEAEVLVEVKQEQTTVTLSTEEGIYKLPIMRERGIFMVQPEVVLPETEPIKSWEYDFSGKSITTKVFSSNLANTASALVVLGENLVARSINHILEEYGDSSTATLSISPSQYALVQKLGKVRVSYYGSGEVSFVGETGEVRVKSSRPPLMIQEVEKNISSGKYITKVDLSKLKLKTMNKFTLDKVYLVFKNGSFSLVTDSARKTLEIPDLVLDEQITLEMMSGDLKHLAGEVTIMEVVMKTQTLYVLKSSEKEKVTYLLVKPTNKSLTW